MKTKLKFFFDALSPKAGRANLRQREFTLRKFFVLCLLAIVAQTGVAGTWNGNQLTFDFNAYPSTFTYTQGAKVRTINKRDLYLLSDQWNALENQIAAFSVGDWKIESETITQGETTTTQKYLTGSTKGGREFSILKLYQGTTVSITYTKISEDALITFVNGSQVNSAPSDGILRSGTTYTIAQDGVLDLFVPRNTKIYNIVINYGSTKHLTFTDATGNSIAGYQNNLPYYRYRLSSREFAEPTPSVFPTYSGGSLNYQYKIENYGTSVGQKEVAVDPNYGTNGDIMFKNLGWCQVTVIAKDGNTEVARASYLVEVWDNEAYYEIENGNKYIFKKDPAISDDNQQGGVLKNRTVTAVPGITMKFGIPESGEEPNTTVVYKYTAGGTGHMVSFINDDNGWWDRYPHNNNTSPTHGTFYSFQASASGKLKFGGVKAGATGKVYVVKLSDLSQTQIWAQGTAEGYYEFTTGLEVIAGETYFLHGEAYEDSQNSANNKWAPFLLEWFSYETSLKLSKSYGVASKPGKEITGSITTDAQVTLNNLALTTTVRDDINNNIEYVCKGNIDRATVSVDGNDYINISNITYKNIGTDNDLKGGAIKVKVKNGDSFLEYVFTIPYGKHVWDFRNATDQTDASRVTDPSYSDTELCTMMKNNTSDWNRVYKVHSKTGGTWSHLIDPLMVAGSKIEGDNAFYMSNTAGLIFITNDIESFGSQQTGFPSGYDNLSIDDQYLQGVDKISATNLVWMKGTSTIYFPGVKADQYIKVYTYRHADDKGENYYVSNLVDLDGNSYSSTSASQYIKIRGASEETGSGIQGDNISGAAIFRVPNGYTYTNVLTSMPSLTLCDDGWTKIFRIEITDDYYPDLKLQKDISAENTGRDDEVTFDSKAASVVLKKKNGTVTPVTTYYLGTSGNVHAQHANTPKYQIIPDAGVTVTAEIENWDSERHVSYNRLKLVFSGGSGNVRIIQREVANHVGTGVLVGHTETTGEGGAKTYTNKTPITLSSSSTGLSEGDYVIDKNEYRIAVGELAVQTYPYTWDFTNYNFGDGENNVPLNATTKANMNGSSSADSWQWTGTWPSKTLTTSVSKQMGSNPVTNPVDDPYQVYNITVPMFAQGADLKATNSGTTTVIAECEGLGVSQPMESEKKYNTTTNISLNGNNLSGAGTITIPDVDNGMYVFVSLSNGNVPWGSVKVSRVSDEETEESLILSALYGETDIFGLKGGVYAFQQTKSGTRDVIIPVSAETGTPQINEVAVTNIVKKIGTTGYATESRDHVIDHTYQGRLTSHDVKAYAITTYNGETYNYKGYPMVKKSDPISVVPQKTGIVLYEDLPSGVTTHTAINSPLFYPAVNHQTPSSADVTTLATNWMAPSIARGSGSSGLAADGMLSYSETIDKGIAQTGTADGTGCTKFILSSAYWVYEKDGTDPGATESQLNNHTTTAAFYRMRLVDGHNTLAGNKAYLLIPTANLPTALWNKGNGQGIPGQSREGVIYIDLQDLEENDATAIDNENAVIDCSADNGVYYSISGARINGKPTAKGFYIHNGKKVSIK